ncbi:MAG: XdhC family protein [Bacteroidetes bacterium]|nr:MAG: XdhC family protein [Bacteroidota bacterium]
MKDYLIYDKISELLKTGEITAICTVVSARGSTPLKAGAKMIVWENGQIYGTIGGGPVELAVIQDAVKVIVNRKPMLFKHELMEQHQMCCGGTMEIYIEPLMPQKKLFMFGGGHVGKALVRHAIGLDFDITVIDSREDVFNDWGMEGFNKVIGDFPRVLPALPYDDGTFIVIATYDHPTDREVLAFCLRKPHYYLGMIGSRNKVRRISEEFLTEGIATKEELDAVDMPIGIDINAVTADEIAISILARLISEKNK